MIIGIDASRANRKNKTGTEWYSFYLIKYLALIDNNNTYVLYLDKEPREDILEIIKDNKNFKIKVLNWPFTSFWTLGRLSLEMIFRSPDVLFVPAHGIPLIHPKKTVNTIHDIAFLRELSVYRQEAPKASTKNRRRLIKFIIRLLTLGKHDGNSLDYLNWSTKFSLKYASSIITVSHFTKSEIIENFPKIKADKIKVVHNGFSSDIFNDDIDPQSISKVLYKYDIKQPYYLYVGRLEKKKNTASLVEALAIVRSDYPEIKEKLLLIGNAGFGYDEVKYAIEEFNLNNDVMMPGWVEEQDMPSIFKGASAFIFPTKHEGFGIPVLQSLACGVTTAVSDIPVLHEVAGEAVLYFNQSDRHDIAKAMVESVLNNKLKEKLLILGKERAKKFNWLSCAKETLAVLEN